MSTIVSRLDIVQIFCDVDDFCNQWEKLVATGLDRALPSSEILVRSSLVTFSIDR